MKFICLLIGLSCLCPTSSTFDFNIDHYQDQITSEVTPRSSKSVPQNAFQVVGRDYAALFAALTFGFLFFWWRKSKNELRSGVLIEQRHPPKGLCPAVCGTLYDPDQMRRNLISLIPYWGSRGYLSVRSIQKKYGFEKDDLYLEKLKVPSGDFPQYQKLIFDQIFEAGDFVLVSTIGERFNVHHFSKGLWQYLDAELAIFDEKYNRLFKGPWALTLMFLSFALIPVVLYFNVGFLTTAFLVATFVLSTFIFFSAPNYSEAGWLLKQEISAFKEFLDAGVDTVSGKMINDDSTFFEQLFPYAVAFGLDKKFAEKFTEAQVKVPSWFSNDHQKSNNYPTTFTDFREQFSGKLMSSAFSRV